MWVLNELTKDRCLVSDHAKGRFDETIHSEETPLETRLQRAVPWGGQNGGALFLLDRDIVFVTKLRDGSRRDVTTVLTKELAIANMQAAHRHDAGVDKQASSGQPVNGKQSAKDSILARLPIIKKMGTEQLELLLVECAEGKKLSPAYSSTWHQVVQAAKQRLEKIRKTTAAHFELTKVQTMLKSLKMVLQAECTEEQYNALIAKATEISTKRIKELFPDTPDTP